MNNYDNKCKIVCTDNDIVNEADVDRFEEKKFVEDRRRYYISYGMVPFTLEISQD